MQYAVSDVNHHDRYKILTAFVLPRPIAWVTTLGPTGVANAAPFSFFNVFAEDPPLCMFSLNSRPGHNLRRMLGHSSKPRFRGLSPGARADAQSAAADFFGPSAAGKTILSSVRQ